MKKYDLCEKKQFVTACVEVSYFTDVVHSVPY